MIQEKIILGKTKELKYKLLIGTKQQKSSRYLVYGFVLLFYAFTNNNKKV